MKRWNRVCWLSLGLALLAAAAQAFAPLPHATTTMPLSSCTTVSSIATPTRLAFRLQQHEEPRGLVNTLERILDRFDTMKSAGLVDPSSHANDEDDKSTTPSSSSSKRLPPVMMRGPGFKRVLFWFVVAFLYKWYRARFINKIPVWDRQPQWNMVVTNKEQEKELKAFTCKNCGSTLFIARNRNWFFEGDTGLGGLGCYHCGAKGKDNFVMDRDRILEDVGEDDDYFDYERPLDFVTAAERRALLKKAKGDEDVANQMLIDQSSAEDNGASPPEGAMDAVIEKTVEETKRDEDEAINGERDVTESGSEEGQVPINKPADDQTNGDVSSTVETKPKKKKKKKAVDSSSPSAEAKDSDASSTTKAIDEVKQEKPVKKDLETSPKKAVSDDDPWDDLDALGI